jgi:pectin methylesterase-like acyl-CoA thioesterase
VLLDPARIYAGETTAWTLSLAAYPASEWTLELAAANATHYFAVEASADDDDHLLSITAAVTATYTAGTYPYSITVKKGAGETLERYRIESGDLVVLPLIGGAAVQDTRSADERILDAIIATMEGRASTDQTSVSIDGTSISRMTWDELISARNEFQRRVSRRKNRSRITYERF